MKLSISSSLKDFTKQCFPSIFYRLKSYRAYNLLKKAYLYDIKRYFEHSDYFYNDSEQRCMMRIIHRYHSIEKGLCMPEMRLGFGKENISELIKDCVKYKKKHLFIAEKNNSAGYQQFKHAVGTLLEYKQIHLDAGYSLSQDFLQTLDFLSEGFDFNTIDNQIETTKEKYLKNVNSSFEEFSESRYSLRNFAGKIKTDDIIKAVEIAQNSPSACNRQPARVHIIENEELKNNFLNLQGGNRGFGFLADKVIIVSVELAGYRGINERNGLFVDGGIYAMNLLYALHSKKIGTCSLNWSYTPEKDLLLRKMIDFPDSQTPVMIIACGGVPDKFKLTFSKRSSVESVIFQH